MGVKIEINLTNKWLYTLFFLALIGIFALGAHAYNTGLEPAAFGHTADEIDIAVGDGTFMPLQEYLDQKMEDFEQLIEDKVSGIGAVECSPTPIYDSMVYPSLLGVGYKDAADKYQAGVKEIPISCMSDNGCIIQQEIYDSKGLKLVRRYDYIQYDTNRWQSSTYKVGTTYLNGDTDKRDIVPAYGNDNGKLYLKDDQFKSGAAYSWEQSPTQWTFIDRTSSWGMKIYICAEKQYEVE